MKQAGLLLFLCACQPVQTGIRAQQPAPVQSSPESLASVLPVVPDPKVSPSVPVRETPVPVPSFFPMYPNASYSGTLERGQDKGFVLHTTPGKAYTLTYRDIEGIRLHALGSRPELGEPDKWPGLLPELRFTAFHERYYLWLSGSEVAGTASLDLSIREFEPDSRNPGSTQKPSDETEISGMVYDDSHQPLDDVLVTARSYSGKVPYLASVRTVKGAYSFKFAVPGHQMALSASKPGFTDRQRVVSLNTRKTEPPVNIFDFGHASAAGPQIFALSDKPEIYQPFPNRNFSESFAIPDQTYLILYFSEPMDPASVEDDFELRAFRSTKLSVDHRPQAHTFQGSGSLDSVTGSQIWNSSAFDITWDDNYQEAHFSFKKDLALPNDRDQQRVPEYQVTLEAGDKQISDKQGNVRRTDEGGWYYQSSDGLHARSFSFRIAPSTFAPRIDKTSLNAKDQIISLHFSKQMRLVLPTLTIAGGLGSRIDQAPAGLEGYVSDKDAARNYTVSLKRAGQMVFERLSWAELGGYARFNPADHRIVELGGTMILPQPGDVLDIEAAATIVDPAGNSIDPLYRKKSLTY